MNLFKLMIGWIVNTWILFWDLVKGKKQELSEGNQERKLLTVEVEIHHDRCHMINNARFKRKTGAETANKERFQTHNNREMINIDAIEKA